jgi:hypothetical protein
MFSSMFAKDYNFMDLKKIYLIPGRYRYLTKNLVCQAKYPAGYKVYGFWISRISGKNSTGIRCIHIFNNYNVATF